MSLVKSEFKAKHFLLDYTDPNLLISARWKIRCISSKWPYLAFRTILAAYHLGWWLSLIIYEEGLNSSFGEKFYFFLYMTNWSYTLLTITNIVWAVNVYRHRGNLIGTSDGQVSFPNSLKVQWLLQNMTFVAAVIVSLVYWLALHEPGHPVDPSNIEAHLMNSVFVLLDLVVSATPIRLLHFYQPLTYFSVYVLFSVIYYLAGGTTASGDHFIYTVLDWQKPGPTLAFLGIGIVATLLIQVAVWLIYLAREQLFLCIHRNKVLHDSTGNLPQQNGTYASDLDLV